MTHEEALNMMLADCCGQLTDEEVKNNGGVQTFHIELHCSSYTVAAKELGNLKYEVVSVEKNKS